MADTLPSPPESPLSTADTETEDLTARLDSLLEQYLNLLDKYTALREDLSRTFSAGFFSLAQAQRTSTLGAGRRYGEEGYDERMKAQRRVSWHSGTALEEFSCKITKNEKKDNGKSEDELLKQASTDSLKGSENVEESKQQKEGDMGDKPEYSKMPSKAARPKQDPATRDPLTWFGILVAPALRQTQAQFVKATENQIPDLLAVESRLRSTERQIWNLREQLGILSEYEQEEFDRKDVTAEVIQSTQEAETPQSTKENRSSKKPLASRPPHSKSHLLKLGD